MMMQAQANVSPQIGAFFSHSGGYLRPQGGTPSTRKYRAKEQIFAQGDGASTIYEVIAGCIKLMRFLSDGRQQIVGFFFADDIIGLTAGELYSYSAVAITPTRLRPTKKLDVLRRMMSDDKLGENIIRLASDEIAAAHDQMTLLGCKRPLEKVASFIAAMSRKSSIYDEVSKQVYLPMTQMDMGSYLGLALETVCRTFQILKKQGVISDADRHFIRINDIDALLGLADITTEAWSKDFVNRSQHAR